MTDVKRSVIRLDKVRGTKVGHISSVVYADGELENGFVGVKGDLLTDERELRELKLVADVAKEPLVLIASPELRYEEYTRDDASLQKFYIEQGRPARAFELEKGDIFSVSKEGVTALATDAVVGNYVVGAVGSLKLTEIATPLGTEAFVGKIIQKEKIGTVFAVGEAGNIGRQIDFTVIEVIKNEA